MIVTENKGDFKCLERNIYETVCQLGREVLVALLQKLDDRLMLNRDRNKYRHKGKRPTTLKTVMGEVEYERAVYEYKGEDGKKRCIYLLDEELGCKTVGHMSELLCERIAEAACDGSYRKASSEISELCGQSVSHTGAWNVVQALGASVEKEECWVAQLAAQNKGHGQEVTKLLFEEQDGVFLNLQGKDRKKQGKSAEMKIAIAYTGAKKTGDRRYNLTGKVACAKFEESAKFFRRKEGVIAAAYNVDEIAMRVLNGDGASWIKRSITDETVHYQLDTFHRNKAVMTYVSDPEARKTIFRLLYTKDIKLCLEVIEAYANSTMDEKERENYLSLLTYFQNNKDGLISYKRRGLNLPTPEEDIEYRGLGAMESNVFSIIGRRMKRCRANWSIRGGNNLASLLTLKATGKLRETLSNLAFSTLPEKYAEEVTTVLSAAKIPKRVGKGYNGFAEARIPDSVPWLKEISKLKPLSQIRF